MTIPRHYPSQACLIPRAGPQNNKTYVLEFWLMSSRLLMFTSSTHKQVRLDSVLLMRAHTAHTNHNLKPSLGTGLVSHFFGQLAHGLCCTQSLDYLLSSNQAF